MRLALVSDLHVDFRGQPHLKIPDCDVLLVSGDTANDPQSAVDYLRRLSKRNHGLRILFSDGNHEHYDNVAAGRTVRQTQKMLEELAPPTCTYLPAHGSFTAYYCPAHLYFVGRNGWYSFDLTDEPRESQESRWKRVMNDDKCIGFSGTVGHLHQVQPWTLARNHTLDLALAIHDTITLDPDARFVVSTHTVPNRDLLHKGPQFISTNPFYVNCHMERLAAKYRDRIVLWTYGHTHFSGDRTIDGVRYLANPRGYPRENPSWQPHVEEIQ